MKLRRWTAKLSNSCCRRFRRRTGNFKIRIGNLKIRRGSWKIRRGMKEKSCIKSPSLLCMQLFYVQTVTLTFDLLPLVRNAKNTTHLIAIISSTQHVIYPASDKNSHDFFLKVIITNHKNAYQGFIYHYVKGNYF